MIEEIKGTDVPEQVEMAARVFASGIASFLNEVDSLSVKSARRVLKALVEFPLNDENKKLLAHQSEAKLFEKAMELLAAKAQMIDFVVRHNQEKQLKKEGEENGKV